MFFFPCPGCTFRMQSTPDRIGQRVLCPKCYRAVAVPDPDSAAFDHLDDTVPAEREPDLHPRTARIMAPLVARSVPPAQAGAIVLFQPSSAFAADAMTQLTTNITMRMKPPPEIPPPDLKMSTAVWIALTATGIIFWCATVIYQGGPLHYVTAIAVIQFSIGIGWIAYLAGRRHWLRGLLTLFPPIAIYRLVQGHGPNHSRPMRFVLSGLLLLALVYANPVAREAVRHAFGMDEHKLLPSAVPDAPAARLASFTGRADRSPLLAELKRISSPEIVNASSPAERPAVATELRKVIKMDDRPELTAAAFVALIAWAGDEAKPDLVAAVQSASSATRKMAVPLIAKWKDADAARAIIPLLRKWDERFEVTAALKTIGSPAEGPLMEFLPGLSDSMAGVAALGILEEIGTQKSVLFLTAFADSADDLLLREIARGKAVAIEKRLKKAS